MNIYRYIYIYCYFRKKSSNKEELHKTKNLKGELILIEGNIISKSKKMKKLKRKKILKSMLKLVMLKLLVRRVSLMKQRKQKIP